MQAGAEVGIRDIDGLSGYIKQFQQHLKSGDEKWMLDNDPRFIQIAEWEDIEIDEAKRLFATGNYPNMSADDGRVLCLAKFGDLSIVIVEHAFSTKEEGEVGRDTAIYLKDKERWWVTRNKNMRVALGPFKEQFEEAIRSPEDQKAFAENECMKMMKY